MTKIDVIDLSSYETISVGKLKSIIPFVLRKLKEGYMIKFLGERNELELLRFVSCMHFDETGDEREIEFHKPVMVKEVIEGLKPKGGDILIDATAGTGGHTSVLLEKVKPDGMVIAFEKDPLSFEILKRRLSHKNVILRREDFADMERVMDEISIGKVDGVLFDLGISSCLLERSGRGFSYKADEPLDMRFDPEEGLPAQEYLQHLQEEELAWVFRNLGEERFARKIAREIVRMREKKKITSTGDLNAVIERAVPLPHILKAKMRVYLSLRILVNDELNKLVNGLLSAFKVLKVGGLVVVISYHSLEDRIVKRASNIPGVIALTKKPITPTKEEILSNRRARSAKLRVLKKIGEIHEETFLNLLLPAVPSPRSSLRK
jgi:16S rRNA (cytosine1402-N4)-methyltransferase